MEFCLQAVGPAAAATVRRAGGGRPGGHRISGRLRHADLKNPRPVVSEARNPDRLAAAAALEAADRVRPGRRALSCPPMRDALHATLGELGRLAWLSEEMADWPRRFAGPCRSERWRRVSGNAGLDARGLAIVRELWQWRDAEARAPRPARPPRAARRPDRRAGPRGRRPTRKRIHAVRGMERGDLVRRVDEIAACIQRALALPEEQCPPRPRREPLPQLLRAGPVPVRRLGQHLPAGAACARTWSADPTTSATGSPTVAAGARRGRPPRLARGWRAEFVGRLLENLLAGKMRGPRRRPAVGPSAADRAGAADQRSAVSSQQSAADGRSLTADRCLLNAGSLTADS